jgi:cell wall-associated NlpC family hydrolase
MTALDPRRNAFRPDLADVRLAGKVESSRFTAGRPMQVMEPVIGVHKAPRFDAMQVTQALMGEAVAVFDEHDGYVGYVNANALSPSAARPTHRVAVPSTFMYPEPSLKTQPAVILTMNAMVAVAGGEGKFARLSNGRFVFAAHLKPADQPEADFVAVAEQFRNAPYYWGGKSVHGLDCSGLVQLSLEACGIAAPRDSDMQEACLGRRLPVNDAGGLERGDLVFWSGHVGIMCDAGTLLHASGHHMMVVAEPLQDAVDRTAAQGSPVTSIRRL